MYIERYEKVKIVSELKSIEEMNQNALEALEKKSGRKVAFTTLGCKVNQYETEAMSELFVQKGYQVVSDEERSDIYVINTCSVTNLGEKKSRQLIRKMKRKNPEAVVAVVGCYSQVATDEVMAVEGVNLVVGTNERKHIVDYVEDLGPADKVSYVGDIMQVRDFEELSIEKVSDKTRAFIKIQEGCNQFCSYCIIPYARGPIRSRKPENVVQEIQRLVAYGFSEIVLTGIHIASYGKDLGNIDLLEIIKRVHAIEGVKRLRLGSLEPTLLTETFVSAISQMENFCPHFHLSLQSGSDTVLKRMNRKYTTKDYLSGVNALKAVFENPSFTTDVIVGFPGETEEEFNETLTFVKQVEFSKIHVFQYSPKKGTKAATMDCQVDAKIKHERSEKLIAVSSQMESEYQALMLGRVEDVLFESELTLGTQHYMEGLTSRYVRVAVPYDENQIGAIKRVKLESVKGELVFGTVL